MNAEAEIFGRERFGLLKEKIVEFGAGLAADGDGVFKAGGGDKGDTRAFTFEQRIGADGGSVTHFNRVGMPAICSHALRMAAPGSAGVEGIFNTRRPSL